MKPKHYKILFFCLKWAFIIALGYFLILLTFQVSHGRERLFDVGHGYVIAEWPGPLWYRHPEGYLVTDNLLDAYIEAFMVADPWLIGKTRNGWFAVEKEKKEIHYPVSSENQVKEITGVNFSSSDLVTERPKSFWWPWTYEYKPHIRERFGYIGTGYAVVVFLVIMARRAYRRRKKLRVDASQE